MPLSRKKTAIFPFKRVLGFAIKNNFSLVQHIMSMLEFISFSAIFAIIV